MLMKIVFSFRFARARFLLNFRLFLGVFYRLFPVRITRSTGQAHFGIEHRRLDSLRLIKRPLISRFDLFHHRFVGVTARKQTRNRRQHRENSSAQRHPRDPFLATVFGPMVNVFMQMFEWDLGFLHRRLA